MELTFQQIISKEVQTYGTWKNAMEKKERSSGVMGYAQKNISGFLGKSLRRWNLSRDLKEMRVSQGSYLRDKFPRWRKEQWQRLWHESMFGVCEEKQWGQREDRGVYKSIQTGKEVRVEGKSHTRQNPVEFWVLLWVTSENTGGFWAGESLTWITFYSGSSREKRL